MQRWESQIFKDLQDVLAVQSIPSPRGRTTTVHGAMSPGEFHRAIARTGDQFYSKVKLPPPKSSLLANESIPGAAVAKPITLPLPPPPRKKSLASSGGPKFPIPSMLNAKPKGRIPQMAWGETKQPSFVFENVLTQKLDDTPEIKKLQPVRPPLSLSLPVKHDPGGRGRSRWVGNGIGMLDIGY